MNELYYSTMKLNLDKNFTGIPHELIERVLCRVNLKAYEHRIFYIVARMSWGWKHRPHCYTTYRELAEKTGLDPRNVSRTVKQLEDKFIFIRRTGRKKTYLEINTDYMTWRVPEIDTLFTSSSPKVINRPQLKTYKPVVSGDNTGDNKALSDETTKCVVSGDNTDLAQSHAGGYFDDRLKKVLKNK